jgi:hypothetical protein
MQASACRLTSEVPVHGVCQFVRRVAVTAGGHRDTVDS